VIDGTAFRRHRLIARTELRRGWRKMSERKTQLAVLGFVGLMMFFPLMLFGGLLFGLGADLRTGGDVPAFVAVEQLRSLVSVMWLGVAGFVVIRTVNYRGDPDAPDGLLTTVTAFDAVVGLLLAETIVIAGWLAIPVAVLVGGFVVGSHAVAPVLALPVVAAVVLAWAVPLGFLVGIGVRHALLTVEPLARNKTAITILASIAYFGLLITDAFGAALSAVFPLLAALPPGWIADLLVVDVPTFGTAPFRVLASLAITIGVVPALVLASARVAEAHWLADGVIEGDDGADADAESSAGASTSERLADLLPDGVGRPTRSVVRTVVLRARRAPVRLLYLAYPLFGAFPLAQDVYRTGAIPAYVPWLLAGFAVWAAGSAFTLNVLGDQGATMPAVLSAPGGGRHVVVGSAVAGTLLALVPGVGLVALVGALGPLAPVETAALAAVTAIGIVGATLLATGIGITFPRFGSVQVANNREATVPSKSAFAIYSLLVVPFVPICWLLASASAPGSVAGALSLGASGLTVRAIAAIVLAIWLVLAAGSARYALDRVQGHTLD